MPSTLAARWHEPPRPPTPSSAPFHCRAASNNLRRQHRCNVQSVSPSKTQTARALLTSTRRSPFSCISGEQLSWSNRSKPTVESTVTRLSSACQSFPSQNQNRAHRSSRGLPSSRQPCRSEAPESAGRRRTCHRAPSDPPAAEPASSRQRRSALSREPFSFFRRFVSDSQRVRSSLSMYGRYSLESA